MKKLFTVGLMGLLLAAFAIPALAWEFEMKGDMEWRYRHFSRLGTNDLFGQGSIGYDIGFAGPNIYGHNNAASLVTPRAATAPTGGAAGMRIVRGGFSFAGPDAFYNDSRLTLRPTIHVNPAIRVFGVYNIGGYRNKYRQWNDVSLAPTEQAGVGTPPLERYYMHQTSPNAYDTAAIGSWEQFRFTVHSPWAIWSLGIKDFPFGLGVTNAYNVRAESFFTTVPYGPFRLMHALWSAQNVVNTGWGVNPDPDCKPTFMQAATVMYQSGPFDMGAQLLAQNAHIKSLYRSVPSIYTGSTSTGDPTGAGFGYDRFLRNWIVYAKYNNGRFFGNVEYSWVTMDRYNLGARPSYTEAYHWFVETGVYSGPAKVAFMAAAASGSVLNNSNPTKAYASFPVNYQAIEPYEWLMFSTYGGGNQQFGGLLSTDDGTGQIGDAYVLAGRIDHAVAANLNVWGTFMWAHRLEQNGVAFGAYQSNGASGYSAAGVPTAETTAFATNAGRGTIAGRTAYPYGWVSDGYIGWEANVGVDWKLLENLTMKLRYAYWQPGTFFKEAYQARMPSTAGLPLDSQVLTTRDAIQGVQGSLIVEF
jgi:hypothetical protein